MKTSKSLTTPNRISTASIRISPPRCDLAQATFPEDSARRVVLLTDGNENVGDGLTQAQGLAEAGIGIDVVPIRYPPRAEVAVEKVVLPPDVNRGQPFDLRVVLDNVAPPDARKSPSKERSRSFAKHRTTKKHSPNGQ